MTPTASAQRVSISQRRSSGIKVALPGDGVEIVADDAAVVDGYTRFGNEGRNLPQRIERVEELGGVDVDHTLFHPDVELEGYHAGHPCERAGRTAVEDRWHRICSLLECSLSVRSGGYTRNTLAEEGRQGFAHGFRKLDGAGRIRVHADALRQHRECLYP